MQRIPVKGPDFHNETNFKSGKGLCGQSTQGTDRPQRRKVKAKSSVVDSISEIKERKNADYLKSMSVRSALRYVSFVGLSYLI